ncbi:hypothetical protein ACFJGV_16125 [Cnuibacter sp. UC19_7]|uniref:hypothetical protein n=1 Tax=Cnuibacter sp. UC19_7 TaxID=3350166 RepID=UPI00366B69D7
MSILERPDSVATDAALASAHVAAVAPAVAGSLVEVDWLSPEPKLWVGSRGGEFAGMVEFSNGHFLATDRIGASLGAHPTLDLAKQRVAAPPHVVRSVLAQAAVVAGVIASAVALMSLSLVTL